VSEERGREEAKEAHRAAPAPKEGSVLLATGASGVTIRFGGLTAVKDFKLSLKQGELVGLIGPNGAGKTTAFNLLTGVYQPTEGEITLCGKPIRGLRPHQIAALGLTRTFQNIRLFKDLSVIENVLVAMHLGHKATLAGAVLSSPAARREEGAMREEAARLLGLLDLAGREGWEAKNLPYGAQRRLEIARALATRPKVLLLDEPAAGMNDTETDELMEMIRRLRGEFGVTILLIEHDMGLVMGICERIIVLDHGLTIAEGAPDEIKRHPEVLKAYLGEEES
jgi:branched-chain amino acid transport system ATP-binding protein